MNVMAFPQRFAQRASRTLLPLVVAAALAACSSYKPPPPSPLQPNPASVSAGVAWSQRLPADVNFPLQVAVNGAQITVADSKGNVQALQAATGALLWQANVGKPINAGVGSDGATAAVVTVNNELVTIRNGAVAWRAPLPAETSTAPYVAGGRVFVVTADRSVLAFDAGNGFPLWRQKARIGNDSLVLRQNSLITAMGGTLLVGMAGRTIAFNPDTGAALGEALLTTARATNDVARMQDVLAPALRAGGALCARTFQTAVSCVDYARGVPLWTQPDKGATGISGDTVMVVGSDEDGNVTAWSRTDGKPIWKNSTLRYRNLGAPLLAGDNVLVGDAQGLVHVLARSNGALRNRVAADTAAITAPPVLAGNTVVVVSNKGVVSGLRLQ